MKINNNYNNVLLICILSVFFFDGYYGKDSAGDIYLLKEADGSTIQKESGNLDSPIRDFIRGLISPQSSSREFGSDSGNAEGGIKAGFGGVINKITPKIRPIHPGTKWCGDGNKSRSFDDLGRFSDVDSCCRQHDMCPEWISAGKTDDGLANTGLFSRSHCDCDAAFYRCLKDIDRLVSREIGVTYFTILGPQCFKKEHPIVGCEIKRRNRCVKYILDERGEMRLQWFDNPKF